MAQIALDFRHYLADTVKTMETSTMLDGRAIGGVPRFTCVTGAGLFSEDFPTTTNSIRSHTFHSNMAFPCVAFGIEHAGGW